MKYRLVVALKAAVIDEHLTLKPGKVYSMPSTIVDERLASGDVALFVPPKKE